MRTPALHAFDPFLAAILAAVGLAAILPCRGAVAGALGIATSVLVALLFFLHGAKLSREALRAGAGHVRLHVLVFATTFALFPLLGLALRPFGRALLSPELYDGLLFLCVLPATVQSAVVFTSVARGNVAASVCSASGSSLLGVLLTPLLVRLVLSDSASASMPASAIRDVVLQLLVPFVVGHLSRPLTGRFVARHGKALKFVDQGTIVLVVYVSFSEAVRNHAWSLVPLPMLASLAGLDLVLLAAVLTFTWQASKRLGFGKEDEIAIVFGGSKKSLASGVAMANVLFSSKAAFAMVLPLMIFHQMQLMACSVIARRYAARPEPTEE